jgi:hypothetical protein
MLLVLLFTHQAQRFCFRCCTGQWRGLFQSTKPATTSKAWRKSRVSSVGCISLLVVPRALRGTLARCPWSRV